MKYKLINKNSCSKNGVLREGESCRFNNNCIYPNCCEEHLCDKVTIDGFDYYVSDTRITELSANDRYYTIVENPRRIVRYSKHIQSKDAVIIATNNPNIDIPKVGEFEII